MQESIKILLTGATGFIGRHLLESIKLFNYRVFAIATNTEKIRALLPSNIELIDLDIADEMGVAILMETYRPDVVIHTAALSKPNDCENNQEAAFEINVMATKNLVECCCKHQARLIFLSTDMVFDYDFPCHEVVPKNPVNYYGKTKSLAEDIILDSGCNAVILRVMLVYGKVLPEMRQTFLHWVKEQLVVGNQIYVYTDQKRNILYVEDLCRTVISLLEHKTQGIYHLAANEVYTPYSLAVEVADYLHLNKENIHPITSATHPEIANRAAISLLDTTKAQRELNFTAKKLKEVLPAVFV